MPEYAPDAIRALFDGIAARIPSAIMSGIIGDQAHTYGYHRGRDYVSGGDYSAQYPQDLAGDGQAACGLDISWAQEGPQFDVSARLLAAVGDPRTAPLRSFYGSTNGIDVCGYDFAAGRPATSDDSHLWHIHLSIHRQWANDWDALAPLVDVIAGDAPPIPLEEDDMANYLPLYLVGMQGHARPNDVGPAIYLVNDNESTYTWISPAQANRFVTIGLPLYDNQGPDIVGGYRYIGPGDYEIVRVQE